MNRTTIRKHVFLVLFRTDFHEKDELANQDDLYFDDIENSSMSEEDIMTIKTRAAAVREKLTEIDEKISASSEGWTIDRLGKVELTILRLAIYEMLYDETVPVGVAINEAVELAKKFGGDNSPAFVNAVLAKLA